jgi:hypothetical protein
MRQEPLYSLIPFVIYHMLPKHFDFEPVKLTSTDDKKNNLFVVIISRIQIQIIQYLQYSICVVLYAAQYSLYQSYFRW